MLLSEITYITGHIRKLCGLFMHLELLVLTLTRNGSMITGCSVCSESLEESSPPFCGLCVNVAGTCLQEPRKIWDFYPNCKLTNESAIVSGMLIKDMRLLAHRVISHSHSSSKIISICARSPSFNSRGVRQRVPDDPCMLSELTYRRGAWSLGDSDLSWQVESLPVLLSKGKNTISVFQGCLLYKHSVRR